jgi:hypothetical protein
MGPQYSPTWFSVQVGGVVKGFQGLSRQWPDAVQEQDLVRKQDFEESKLD